MLHQALLAQLVSPHLTDTPIAASVPERPVVPRVARYQAGRPELVTNILHQSLDLEPLDRVVLPLLDGTRTAADVTAAIAAALAAGQLAPTATGKPPEEGGEEETAAQAAEEPKGATELAELSLRRLTASCYVLG
jgi:methyltransferase-like protein